MANYFGTCRSNYFRVKDEHKFQKEMNDYEVYVFWEVDLVMLTMNDYEGLWPYEDKDGNEIDFFQIGAKHLVDGEVAVFLEIGHENLKILNGSAIAINNKGEVQSVNLTEIYEKAKVLGEHISLAEY